MDKSLITDDPKIYERSELDFAVSLNFLALGSTMYQMAYAFKKKNL